jgi:hypothetical protein
MACVYVAVGPEAWPGDETNEAGPVLRVLHGWMRTSPSSIDQLWRDGRPVKCLSLMDGVYCCCDGDGKDKEAGMVKTQKKSFGEKNVRRRSRYACHSDCLKTKH